MNKSLIWKIIFIVVLVLLALWDGTSGGTENCIKYALKKSCVIINLWDEYNEL